MEYDKAANERTYQSRNGSESMSESNSLAVECVCKMLKLLDGEFAKQIVDAGGVPCLLGAMLSGDERLADQAESALLCLCDKLPTVYACA